MTPLLLILVLLPPTSPSSCPSTTQESGFLPNSSLPCSPTSPCSSPLGLESGSLPSSSLSATSSYSPTVGPSRARLRSSAGAGAWCPAAMVVPGGRQEHLEVELGGRTLLTGVQTQGRWDEGRGQEFSPFISLEVYREGEGWLVYRDAEGRQELPANSDTYSVVLVVLDPPVLADRVRVVPRALHSRTVCLRLELWGCLALQEGPKVVPPPHPHLALALGLLLTTS